MFATAVIYRNKKDEEIARIVFDENGVPGWSIKSKAEPHFVRKFATQREASALWLREFDPETGKFRLNQQKQVA